MAAKNPAAGPANPVPPPPPIQIPQAGAAAPAAANPAQQQPPAPASVAPPVIAQTGAAPIPPAPPAAANPVLGPIDPPLAPVLPHQPQTPAPPQFSADDVKNITEALKELNGKKKDKVKDKDKTQQEDPAKDDDDGKKDPDLKKNTDASEAEALTAGGLFMKWLPIIIIGILLGVILALAMWKKKQSTASNLNPAAAAVQESIIPSTGSEALSSVIGATDDTNVVTKVTKHEYFTTNTTATVVKKVAVPVPAAPAATGVVIPNANSGKGDIIINNINNNGTGNGNSYKSPTDQSSTSTEAAQAAQSASSNGGVDENSGLPKFLHGRTYEDYDGADPKTGVLLKPIELLPRHVARVRMPSKTPDNENVVLHNWRIEEGDGTRKVILFAVIRNGPTVTAERFAALQKESLQTTGKTLDLQDVLFVSNDAVRAHIALTWLTLKKGELPPE